jgi:putative Mg2+ transporter-C (MgtC) family protein
MNWAISILEPQTRMAAVLWPAILRLALAAFLGGIIGIEREMKHKSAGLRTQMFICIGAALFTILSRELASGWGGDHTRIAAQIIPGIGFIGAGSILRSRGSVTGLTTAATIFVVASIGMAAGGGLYLLATFATLLVLLALLLLGSLEGRLGLKAVRVMYEVTGTDSEQMLSAINRILAGQEQWMESVKLSHADHAPRMQFTVMGSRRQHEALLRQLQQSNVFQHVQSRSGMEQE